MGLINGMCILPYVAELISTFQLNKRKATFSYTMLSVVDTQSNCEQLEESHWLTRGMITLHMYTTLRSVGNTTRKDVSNTINRDHRASQMRGLFVPANCHIINPSRDLRDELTLVHYLTINDLASTPLSSFELEIHFAGCESQPAKWTFSLKFW